MEKFDAIVIGAGHAGCEAGLAIARKGHKTLLLTLSLDAVAFLACNPSIGGTAKGQLVSELDALGGEMGVNIDKTLIQLRMLNRGKGPAVQSLRAQADKQAYHDQMKQTLESCENLFLKQGEAVDVSVAEDGSKIVTTALEQKFCADVVVFATGVYLKSRIIIGNWTKDCGPNGFSNAQKLSDSLEKLGIKLLRFKTGTPARINGRSIDYSVLEVQQGEDEIQNFSFKTKKKRKNQAVCYLTYTNENTHQIIRDNLDKAPMYSGLIKGVGPRYCPSIETKIVRFADKDRHQLFLEPESLATQEVYIQGFSTSMPADVQEKMIHSVKGLEKAEIMRDSYAIEYDCIEPTQLLPTLEIKGIKGLFFAGQINGTSGYEEAAAQGLIAGINAALYLEGQKQLVLKRSDGYIGVLIDDIVTKGTNEPYRMMTSRAEYRLFLRQDNADLRLTEIGREVGLVDDERWKIFNKKKKELDKIFNLLNTKFKVEQVREFYLKNGESEPRESVTVKDMLKRSNIDAFKINEEFELFKDFKFDIINEMNIMVKYEGYLKQQQEEIDKFRKNEATLIPAEFDFKKYHGLRLEAAEKLDEIRPLNIGQASRISGVSPADIAVLSVLVKKFCEENKGEK
ncbi:MAG: tRNA uridine-5-carboxymethylaminomethyl(34) synthesis enzyme MnmG [Clostridiales bacterium]|nr:tRNA uridine-5-carboxymethylaminomethyl(34) synthesis enzyme MnmG [Clostridiales bacterium]